MTPSPAPRRRLRLALAGTAGALALGAALGSAPFTQADVNPNTYDCRGHVEAGAIQPQVDVEDDTQVRYVFACNGPILGYQVQTDVPDTSFDTETFGTDQTGTVVPADAFTCNGDFPGNGINCLGTYRGSYDKVTGQFTISGKLCTEPRVAPRLTVFYATADANRRVTPAISGPYDLGRPRGCPAPKAKKVVARKTTSKKKAAR